MTEAATSPTPPPRGRPSAPANHHPRPADTSYPRLSARTARFTNGLPRAATLDPAGERVTFLRTRSATDRVGLLWQLTVTDGRERLLADPADLLDTASETLSPAERARRERSREAGAGIVAYATDDGASVAAFALSSRLFLASLLPDAPAVRELPAATPVIDPHPDPSGKWVAYATDRSLRVSAADGSGDRELVGPGPEPEQAEVVWGRADFNAAEDMERSRGFWWSPDGDGLLVERYDDGPVEVRWSSDPADPRAEPTPVRYPFAGTANPGVQLWWVPLQDPAARVRVDLDDAVFPYLTRVAWRRGTAPLVELLTRDHRRRVVVEVDPATGATHTVAEQTDPAWLAPVAGVPARAPDGRLLQVVPDASCDTYRLTADGTPLTREGQQVEAVLGVDEDGALVALTSDSVSRHVVAVGWDGSTRALTEGAAVCTGARAGGTVLLTRADLETPLPRTTVVLRDGRQAPAGARPPDPRSLILRSLAQEPPVRPRPVLATVGANRLSTAVLLPTGLSDPAPGSLPVLLDPYGGPGGARVVAASGAFGEAQWWADQGFAVVVADGRGTPGRGPASDRSVLHTLAAATLADQVDALHAVAGEHPEFDLGRVAIRGWSYGGFLAALAVLRRPDVFAAAVSGAPVTDHRLYSTYYTERYYGHPDDVPEVYEANSLLPAAAGLTRPLMLIHGLADDNVLVAHTLALSGELLAAGRPHEVLPLTGVTHMASQETVAANLLVLQLDFLRRALARPAT